MCSVMYSVWPSYVKYTSESISGKLKHLIRCGMKLPIMWAIAATSLAVRRTHQVAIAAAAEMYRIFVTCCTTSIVEFISVSVCMKYQY